MTRFFTFRSFFCSAAVLLCFANLAFGSVSPIPAAPEPATFGLVAGAVGVLLLVNQIRKRRGQ